MCQTSTFVHGKIVVVVVVVVVVVIIVAVAVVVVVCGEGVVGSGRGM